VGGSGNKRVCGGGGVCVISGLTEVLSQQIMVGMSSVSYYLLLLSSSVSSVLDVLTCTTVYKLCAR
jgi:hypothetical protein